MKAKEAGFIPFEGFSIFNSVILLNVSGEPGSHGVETSLKNPERVPHSSKHTLELQVLRAGRPGSK